MGRRHPSSGPQGRSDRADSTGRCSHLNFRRLRALLRRERRALSPHHRSAHGPVGTQSPQRHDHRPDRHTHRRAYPKRHSCWVPSARSRSTTGSRASMRSSSSLTARCFTRRDWRHRPNDRPAKGRIAVAPASRGATSKSARHVRTAWHALGNSPTKKAGHSPAFCSFTSSKISSRLLFRRCLLLRRSGLLVSLWSPAFFALASPSLQPWPSSRPSLRPTWSSSSSAKSSCAAAFFFGAAFLAGSAASSAGALLQRPPPADRATASAPSAPRRRARTSIRRMRV